MKRRPTRWRLSHNSMKGSPFTLAIALSMWLILSLGCANSTNSPNRPQSPGASVPSTTQPTAKPVVDIPQLITKSPAELDNVLGKPAAITKLTDDPDMMPGEYRDYRVESATPGVTQYGLMIRVYKGRAVHFTLDLPRPTDTPQDALLMAGIDVSGTAPKTKAPLAHRWSGRFNGMDFKDVAALKMDSAGTKYTTVQADTAQ